MSGRKERRNRFEIFGDILEAVEEEVARDGVARMTRLHLRSSVSYDRLREYVEQLDRKGLISVSLAEDGHKEIRATERGIKLLREYRRVKEFLSEFGLSEGDDEESANAGF